MGHYTSDPGFKVEFFGLEDNESPKVGNLAEDVLKNCWARLQISLDKDQLKFNVSFLRNGKSSFTHSQKYKSNIHSGLAADIRFFPRRGGIFSNKGIDGWTAWDWIHDNSGIAIIDRGFRIKPYGFGEDDWLHNSQDAARNARNWRSKIMRKHYEIPEHIYKEPQQNPMLNLPANHQLVGAVFVESGVAPSGTLDLIPSTDREGFLNNEAFDDLYEIVRAGIEMLALADKREKERSDAEEAEESFQKTRSNIKKAIEYVKSMSTLTKTDKDRVIKEFAKLSEDIDLQDERTLKFQRNLEAMSSLGSLAGFMSHESERILFALKDALEKIRTISRKHSELSSPLEKIEESYNELAGHIEYSKLFIHAIHSQRQTRIKVLPQIKRTVRLFEQFNKRRDIQIAFEINDDIETPELPITLYSGVLLNLLTNAIKAVVAGTSKGTNPKIVIRAFNGKQYHTLEFMDKGVGIPPFLEERIWEPLFTTTSDSNNPFGTGMGLGLHIVQELLKSVKGKITLVTPKPGFSTCFRVEIPVK